MTRVVRTKTRPWPDAPPAPRPKYSWNWVIELTLEMMVPSNPTSPDTEHATNATNR
jgi:hypothetical protein